ncbi:MAG: Rrf2 family transcriptional regulator [Candidatus Omnitrophica bacterium]|nr:Rrf2 family transcriptional regulator [Candidatus Omnitrophota bacterium]
MKINSRLDYALSCAIRIADKYKEKKPVSVASISAKERIDSDYVEQLLICLKRAKILKSVRGPGGGYMLAKAPNKILAKDIVLAVEREVLELICYRQKGRRVKCIHSSDCKVKGFWLGLKEKMESYLVTYSLKDLVLLRRKQKDW